MTQGSTLDMGILARYIRGQLGAVPGYRDPLDCQELFEFSRLVIAPCFPVVVIHFPPGHFPADISQSTFPSRTFPSRIFHGRTFFSLMFCPVCITIQGSLLHWGAGASGKAAKRQFPRVFKKETCISCAHFDPSLNLNSCPLHNFQSPHSVKGSK